MAKKKRFRPKYPCTFKGKYWTPDEPDVLVAEKANEHFYEIGSNPTLTDTKPADVELDEAGVGIDTMTEEEKASEIRKAVEGLDKGNKDLFTTDGKPKVEVVEQIVKFDTSRKEIEKAMTKAGDSKGLLD